VVAVLLAGAGGALLRYALSRALPVRPGHLPGGILVVNVVGSGVAGALIGLAERAALDGDLRLILVTGFCGRAPVPCQDAHHQTEDPNARRRTTSTNHQMCPTSEKGTSAPIRSAGDIIHGA